MIATLIVELKALEDRCLDEGRLSDMDEVGAFISHLESLSKARVKKASEIHTPDDHEVFCECERCPHCGEVIED